MGTVLTFLFYAVHSFAGLAYEVVWVKSLAATVGMSLPAMGVVLATFMAGLGLGSYLLSRLYKDTQSEGIRSPLTHRSPLTVFAVLQAATGLLGVAFPFLLSGIDDFYMWIAPPTEGVPHVLIRSAFSAILLIPVTSLLGTGFPLLAAISATQSVRTPSQRPGLLYFVGLVASGAGALGSLFMIPALGLWKTSALLGGLNLLTATGAVLANTFNHSRQGDSQSMAAQPLPSSPCFDSASCPWRVLSLGGLIGFFVMTLEITGAQYLWLIVNATAYAEGVLFAAVLFAMAVGSGLFACLRRLRAPCSWLLWGSLVGAALAQVLLIPFAADIAQAFDSLIHEQSGWGHEWIGTSALRFLVAHGVLALAVLGIPALGYGMAFSSLCELALTASPSPQSDGVHDVKRLVMLNEVVSPIGRLYAWHNWGAIGGAIGATFVFIPTLGLTTTLMALSALLLGIVMLDIGNHRGFLLGLRSDGRHSVLTSSASLPPSSGGAQRAIPHRSKRAKRNARTVVGIPPLALRRGRIICRILIGLAAVGLLLWVGFSGDLRV